MAQNNELNTTKWWIRFMLTWRSLSLPFLSVGCGHLVFGVWNPDYYYQGQNRPFHNKKFPSPFIVSLKRIFAIYHMHYVNGMKLNSYHFHRSSHNRFEMHSMIARVNEMCKLMKLKPFQGSDESNKFSLKHIEENVPRIKNRDPSHLDRFVERHVQCSVFDVEYSDVSNSVLIITKYRTYVVPFFFLSCAARPDVNSTVVMKLNVGHPY